METQTTFHLTSVNGCGERAKPESESCSRRIPVGNPVRRPARAQALLTLLLLTALSVFAVSTTSDAFTGTPSLEVDIGASGNVTAPVPDAIDDIIDVLKQLEKDLEQAEELVAGGGYGRPDDPNPSSLDCCLDDAEDLIDLILDPLADPSLEPADAGAVDPSVAPTTLTEYADDCLQLAEEAVDEAEYGCPADHDVIGTRIKTIKACLPGYRAAAGL
jgi:hypothetical protein